MVEPYLMGPTMNGPAAIQGMRPISTCLRRHLSNLSSAMGAWAVRAAREPEWRGARRERCRRERGRGGGAQVDTRLVLASFAPMQRVRTDGLPRETSGAAAKKFAISPGIIAWACVSAGRSVARTMRSHWSRRRPTNEQLSGGDYDHDTWIPRGSRDCGVPGRWRVWAPSARLPAGDSWHRCGGAGSSGGHPPQDGQNLPCRAYA